MSEQEVPTEHLHETIHEEAHGGSHPNAHHAPDRWILKVALSAALLAVLAAVAALFAGHHADEAIIEQLQASDEWNYYQAKGIKFIVLESKADLLAEMGKPIRREDTEKIAEYKRQQKEIEEKARERERSSQAHRAHHNILAKAVTLFQIAIASSAIAVLTKRRGLWYGSLLLGMAGVVFFIQGLL